MEHAFNILLTIGMVAGFAVIVAYVIAYARDKEVLSESCKACIWIIWFYTIGAFFAKRAGGVFALVLLSVLFIFVTLWLVRIWRDSAKISRFKKWQDNFHEKEREE